jgi:hypothetical protein
MSYPAGQTWGAIFITIGEPRNPPRPSQDFAAFDTLLVEMRGESGGESLDIGLKTSDQPDNGSETKLPLSLTSEWHRYTFPLTEFRGTDLRTLYVVAEFVFSGPNAQTVYLRNVRYSNGSAILSSPSPPARQAVRAAANAQITIDRPHGGNPVCALQQVTGTLTEAAYNVAHGQVWIVVNPMLTPGDFWVQDSLTVTNDRHWTGFVHFGRPGQDVGAPFMFKAFVGPPAPLAVGDSSGWPNARLSSDAVRVARGPC